MRNDINLNSLVYFIITVFCEVFCLIFTVFGFIICLFSIIDPKKVEFEYFYFFDLIIGLFILILGLALCKFGMISFSKRVKKPGIEKTD